MKKKFKHRLTGRKRKPDGMGSTLDPERADSTSSLPQPEPHVVAGDRVDAAEERDFSADPPQSSTPESVPVPARGSDNGQEEEGEGEVDGGETSQKHSFPHSGVKVGVDTGHSGELGGIRRSPSPDST